MRKRSRGSRKRRFSRARSYYTRYTKGRGKFGSALKKGLLGDVVAATGAGVVVGTVTNRVAPQFTPIAEAAAEYFAGGLAGMAGAEILKSVTGRPSILSSFGNFGGLLGGQGMATEML